MDVAELLVETYGRIPSLAARAVDGLDAERLVEAPGPGRNTIAWLVWHLARVQDAQIAELADDEQLWARGDWAERIGLPADRDDTGYGHTPDQVAAVRPPEGRILLDYLHAVAARTESYLKDLTSEQLDEVVDHRWDPPVTLGVRLVSVADDCVQHAGQAAYVRGLLGA
jgi:uncharacterized damage-inducible protein DinB